MYLFVVLLFYLFFFLEIYGNECRNRYEYKGTQALAAVPICASKMALHDGCHVSTINLTVKHSALRHV